MVMTPALSRELERLAEEFRLRQQIRRAALAHTQEAKPTLSRDQLVTARALEILDAMDRDPALARAIELVTADLRADADVGRRVKQANTSGRPPVVIASPDELWADMEIALVRRELETGRKPARSLTWAAGCVAAKYGVSAKHILKLTKPVRDRL